MQIATALHFGHKKDNTMGHLLWASAEAMQLEVGWSRELWVLLVCASYLVTPHELRTFGKNANLTIF